MEYHAISSFRKGIAKILSSEIFDKHFDMQTSPRTHFTHGVIDYYKQVTAYFIMN